ncbi:MarR family transcriptional regulator [Nocardia sp. NPDC055321]
MVALCATGGQRFGPIEETSRNFIDRRARRLLASIPGVRGRWSRGSGLPHPTTTGAGMPLTESQAIVLATLAAREPMKTLTVRQLCDRTGFTSSSIRRMVGALAASGLARCDRRTPAGWRTTARGWALITARRYSDYRDSDLGGDAA